MKRWAWCAAVLVWLTVLLPDLPAAKAAPTIERYPVFQDCGLGYCLLYDGAGNYIAGYGSVNPDVRTGFDTTGHFLPENAFYFRTDLGCAITHVNGVWNETCRGGTLNGEGTPPRVAIWTAAHTLGNGSITDTANINGAMNLAPTFWTLAYSSSTAPGTATLAGVDVLAGTADTAGGSLNLEGGASTGNQDGGTVRIRGAVAAAGSGSSVNTLADFALFGPRSYTIGNYFVRTVNTSIIGGVHPLAADTAGGALNNFAGGGTGTAAGGAYTISQFLPDTATGTALSTHTITVFSSNGTSGALVIGGATTGNGGIKSHVAPGEVVIRGHSRDGSNLGGGILAVEGGPGNGTGVGGGIGFYTYPAGGSGSTRNTRSQAGGIDGVTGVHYHKSGAAVSSAATITPTGNVFHVTGTTTIDTISTTNAPAGSVLTLIFDSTAAVGDLTGNINIGAAFVGTANDTLTLAFDGTTWFEVSRSIN